MEKGLGLPRGGEIGWRRESRARLGLCPEVEGDPDMRDPEVSGRGG
jgi:hypothetical protein